MDSHTSRSPTGLYSHEMLMISRADPARFLLPPPAFFSSFFTSFFFSRFFNESSDTLRMLPYDWVNRVSLSAVIMQDIFWCAPTARTRQPAFASCSGVAFADVFVPGMPADARANWRETRRGGVRFGAGRDAHRLKVT